jgi:hypothetical protein
VNRGSIRILSRRGHRGFAMIALIALVALMSAYLIANALTQTSTQLSNTREQRNMKALLQAKAALIAYAASTEGWQTYKGQTTNQPGGLPCPDRDNPPDGIANTAGCSAAANRVGRLPWSTIGSDDLRDASGEPLWYAVSSSYYKNIGVNDINSDTPGLLTVTGTAPASNVVAVVIAPGVSIQGQNRSGAGIIDPAQYLEGYTPGAPDYAFATNALPSDTFNDRLLAITQADIMAAVEPVVAARMQRDIKPYLNAYKTAWGRYPFPVPFMNPGTSTDNYKGAAGQQWGLLPITTATAAGGCASGCAAWDTNFGGASLDPHKITLTRSGIFGAFSSADCSTATAGTTASTVTCNITYTCTNLVFFALCPTATLTAYAQNVGGTMVLPTPNSAIVATASAGGTSTSSSWSQMDSSGNATITASVVLPGSLLVLGGTATIQVPVPTYDATTNPVFDVNANSTASAAYWFVANQWYQQVFYAVAPAMLPGGGGNCGTTPPCLTVNNMSAPLTNGQAILILAGRSLSGAVRPSANLADYLEGENSTPADSIFEHRSGVPTSINDRVVVVAP